MPKIGCVAYASHKKIIYRGKWVTFNSCLLVDKNSTILNVGLTSKIDIIKKRKINSTPTSTEELNG